MSAGTGKVTLTDEQFAELRALLARAAGLAFDEARRESLSYSIAERLRATGIRDVTTYLRHVALGADDERQRLLDEVTIQETHFFRNPPQVRALREHVLPELVRHAAQNGRRLRVWSAGCSTGEEPYSIAMLLREALPASAGWDVEVLATDVSERALEAARTGRYGPRAVQMCTPDDLARHFVLLPDGTHEVRPEVRSLVRFRHHNLVTEPVPYQADERVDLVLCRNVTIYFSRDTTRALMARLHAALRDGGYLFLGHSETLWQVSDDFRLVALGSGDSAAFVYRRLDAPAAPVREPVAAPAADAAEERRSQQKRSALWEALTKERYLLPRDRTRDRVRDERPTVVRAPAERQEGLLATRAPAAAPAPGVPAQPRPATVLDPVAGIRAALAEGRYDDAARQAAALSVARPLQVEGHYLRGLALVSAGRDAEALVDLRKAVYLDPASGLAHFLLAGVLARLGDAPAAAREYLAAAVALGAAPPPVDAPELGGRTSAELQLLCTQLAEQLAGPRAAAGPHLAGGNR